MTIRRDFLRGLFVIVGGIVLGKPTKIPDSQTGSIKVISIPYHLPDWSSQFLISVNKGDVYLKGDLVYLANSESYCLGTVIDELDNGKTIRVKTTPAIKQTEGHPTFEVKIHA
jgi:hypothetical protein